MTAYVLKNVLLCNVTILYHIPGKQTQMENMRMAQLVLKIVRNIYLRTMVRVSEAVHQKKR